MNKLLTKIIEYLSNHLKKKCLITQLLVLYVVILIIYLFTLVFKIHLSMDIYHCKDDKNNISNNIFLQHYC